MHTWIIMFSVRCLHISRSSGTCIKGVIVASPTKWAVVNSWSISQGRSETWGKIAFDPKSYHSNKCIRHKVDSSKYCDIYVLLDARWSAETLSAWQRAWSHIDCKCKNNTNIFRYLILASKSTRHPYITRNDRGNVFTNYCIYREQSATRCDGRLAAPSK